MTLTFNIFGLEVARINLDIEHDQEPEVTAVDKAAKWVSKEFFKRMVRG